MVAERKFFKLTGKIQHYEWGGFEFIPLLVGIDNKARQPCAEYWLGAHPASPSEAEISEIEFIPIDKLINANPKLMLGEEISRQFGNLPYLLKVLDVRDMLSIQVHPARAEAEAGWARENASNIPLNSPVRNYKDENHKPELVVALSPFYALQGFKSSAKLRSTLNAKTAFRELLGVFETAGYQELYEWVMKMPQDAIDRTLRPVLDSIIPLYETGRLEKNQEDFWAARAAKTFQRNGEIDRGTLCIYIFNLVRLEPGEALFQPAGVPHAYLEGQCVEIMANSDNVIRGGLTNKHIDLDELLSLTRCEPTDPSVLYPEKSGELDIYKTEAKDFELSYVAVTKEKPISLATGSAEIILVLEGNIQLSGPGSKLLLHRGQSAVLFAGAEAELSTNATAMICKASAGIHRGE